MANIRAIHDYLEAHQGQHISKIQEFIRQKSVSDGDSTEVRKCAELLRTYYSNLGCVEAELVQTDGHPGVWAFYDAGAERTIVNYCMYDTQPVGENEFWSSPPFDAEIIDGKVIGLPAFPSVIVGRGAFNSKGPYRAWLNALEAIIAVEGKPPVNIMFVAEGEEEIGSPHLGYIVSRYQDRLRTSQAVLDLEAAQNHEGQVNLSLGYKGNIYFDMECSSEYWGKGARRDVHASLRPILDSPLVHLVKAISSMLESDGCTPAIEGLDEEIQPWPEDQQLIKALAKDAEFLKEFAEENDVIGWIEGLTKEELVYRLFYGNNLNVNGIRSGYDGPGAKTIIPHKATCKVNIRLVPNQEPDSTMAKVRAHLRQHGYSDIILKSPDASGAIDRDYVGYTWSKTSVNEPVVAAVLRTYSQYNVPVRIRPHSVGSEPKHVFNRPPLNLPICLGGLGHGGRHHSPNEYFVIIGNEKVGGLIECEKSHVDILYNFAEG